MGADPDSDAELQRVPDEESEGEDLYDENNYAQDYEEVEELDNYEADGLAEEGDDVDELDPRARERAERAMRKREREEQRRTGRRGNALDSPIEDEPVSEQRSSLQAPCLACAAWALRINAANGAVVFRF